MDYIDVQHLSFYYDDEPVLQDITFQVHEGEFVILTGENGAAKSTLLKSILGLLNPREGSATISKVNYRGEKLTIGYAPQQISSFNIGFPSRVLEFVESGRYQKGRWFKKLDEEDHKKSGSFPVGKNNALPWHVFSQPIRICLCSMSRQLEWTKNRVSVSTVC